MRLRSITTLGHGEPEFIIGTRVCPPASTRASGPFRAKPLLHQLSWRVIVKLRRLHRAGWTGLSTWLNLWHQGLAYGLQLMTPLV